MHNGTFRQVDSKFSIPNPLPSPSLNYKRLILRCEMATGQWWQVAHAFCDVFKRLSPYSFSLRLETGTGAGQAAAYTNCVLMT